MSAVAGGAPRRHGRGSDRADRARRRRHRCAGVFGRAPLPAFASDKWAAITRIAVLAGLQAVAAAQLRETLDDRAAVTTVVADVGEAGDQTSAISVSPERMRTAFGWAYGSYWTLDEDAGVLRFDCESGSAGDEFRKVTLAASLAEGVGLSGRAWKSRDLVFVHDLAEMTDCVRAQAAQRAGVRFGVCFPIMDGARVIGTMDFFTTNAIELSDSRASALRNVQQLVSQRLLVLRRVEADAARARELLDTIHELRAASDDAGRVAGNAATGSTAMTTEVQALADASTAIGNVIKVITSPLKPLVPVKSAGGSPFSPGKSKTSPARPPKPPKESPSKSPRSRCPADRWLTESTPPTTPSANSTPFRPA